VWRRYESATPDETAAAIERARAAQPAWAARSVAERSECLTRFREVLFRRRAEMARTITRENGKPISEALGAEVLVTLDFATWFAREARRRLAPSGWRRAAGLAMWRKQVREIHEPYGVVAVVSPWNYPLTLAGGVVLPALAAGNTVVLKPSEYTPATGVLIGEMLHEAGVPADVMQVLLGDGVTGAALTEGAVDKVFFIGSVATGRRIARACAERLVPCSLELGGSDPAIVLADADVAVAASGVAWGRFSNAGQTCVAPKRVFVVESVYAPFMEALRRTVSQLRVGPGEHADTDVAPLVRPSQTAELRAQLEDALAGGARIAAQATLPAGADPAAWFPPTVLTDVAADSRVLSEETFGPILPVVRVKDEEEAIARANASAFGLSATVWSTDRARALRVARRLETGTVVINDVNVAAGMADVAHGGVKESGTGRSHGAAGLMECVRTKTVIADRWSGWRQAWWFGYGAERERSIDAFVRVAHGGSARERLSGIRRTMRLLLRPERPL
jgi:acyl-CoA reductase-like NAD-dependent aldehyde dehydrogenase